MTLLQFFLEKRTHFSTRLNWSVSDHLTTDQQLSRIKYRIPSKYYFPETPRKFSTCANYFIVTVLIAAITLLQHPGEHSHLCSCAVLSSSVPFSVSCTHLSPKRTFFRAGDFNYFSTVLNRCRGGGKKLAKPHAIGGQ